MTHPLHAQERSDSRNRPFRESVCSLLPSTIGAQRYSDVFSLSIGKTTKEGRSGTEGALGEEVV